MIQEHNQKTAWIALGALALCVALLGGSSRPDAIQIVALRPLSAIFLGLGLYLIRRERLKGGRALVSLMSVLTIVMVTQLIPLPPDIWQALPGREVIAGLDNFLGREGEWRPLSMSPWRSMNALAAVALPWAALLLALSVGAKTNMLLTLLVGLGCANAVLGLLQISTGPDSFLYFYEYSNRGSPIGVFANENHSSVLSALTLLILARLYLAARLQRDGARNRLFYSMAFAVVLLVALAGNSRAGFVSAIVALFFSTFIVFIEIRRNATDGRSKAVRKAASQRVFLPIALASLLLLPGLFFLFDAAPAAAELMASDPLGDARWRITEVSLEMASVFWIFGAGFGAYEHVFHMYEPLDLLRRSYVNHAHNDWLEIVIEGGIVVLFLVVGLLGWLAKLFWNLRDGDMSVLSKRIFWLAVVSIVALASMIDYPLRAPTFQVVAVWALLAFSFDR